MAGAFVAGATGVAGMGGAGDPLWAAAVLMWADPVRRGIWAVDEHVMRAEAGAPYAPGFLALRVGQVLERAIRMLGEDVDVVLLDATGRDHPRRGGLAVNLGWVLDLPTVGVTDRPLVAGAREPADEPGSWEPLMLGDERVGAALRTRAHARPVFVHAGWRTDPDVAVEVVLLVTDRARTPEPLRRARRLARESRALDEGRVDRLP